MSDRPNEWTLEGLVDHFDFVHHDMLDHKFVWVLGAGASSTSGIPLGGQLVDEWLKQLHRRECTEKITVEEWATAECLGIKDFKFDNRASFYSKIYQRRFSDYPDEGYAYLESVMSGKDPSPGYSILAAALAKDPPRHNVVITTNFDNLVADALAIYTDTFPFVAGHESLASFVRVSMRRPLICKIHRDLLLGPQNDSRSLKRLHDAWGTALRALFLHYTPIFIGYGGNDDTLMDLLESFQPGDIKGEMIWCYYHLSKPGARIQNMVADLNGNLVPVPDFDLLMVLLGERMKIGLLDEEIGRRAQERTDRYRGRIQRLDTVKHPSVTRALAATFDRSGGWWAWEQKATLETDLERRETVYRQGIELYPQSPELAGNFANFLSAFLKKYDEAAGLYKKALELDPKNANNTGNFALFAAEVRQDYVQAERLFRKALELDSHHANNTGNFASFNRKVLRDHDEAERLFQKAMELDPNDANIICNLARFMHSERENYDEAERLYRKAIEIDPQHANSIGNLALFMHKVRNDHEEAERLYQKALDLNPTNANNTGNFSQFLAEKGRLDEALDLALRTWALLDPLPTSDHAEIAFTCWLLDRASGRPGTSALARLKTLFQTGFLPAIWSFDTLLTALVPKVTADERALAHKLAAAILDPSKIAALEDEPVWKKADPIPLGVPWPR